MSAVLLVGKDRVSEVTEGIERELTEQEISALANRSLNTPVHIVLDDPAYVSASSPVEFRRRRERTILAKSRFSEIAGEDGVGSWCIAPEGSGFRLYVLALDPNSAELSCLKMLAAEGLAIASISSSLMLGLNEHAPGRSVLRVVVRDTCVQIALRCHGVCIFARRISETSSNAKEAIKTTLLYLQSQGYFDLPFEEVWELSADDRVQAELTDLWTGPEALLPEPHLWNLEKPGEDIPILESSFNCIAWQQERPGTGRSKCLLLITALVASLMLAYVLPQQLLAVIKLPVLEQSKGMDVPEAVLQEFWRRDQIQQQLLASPQAVADDLTLVLEVLRDQIGVSIQEIAVGSGRSYKVNSSFADQYDDPLTRQDVLLMVRDRVAAQLPDHRVRVLELGGHSLDSSQEERMFELMLELAHESD